MHGGMAMDDARAPGTARVVSLNVKMVRGYADEALDAADGLGGIRERLLDMADPRVTPGVTEHVRERLRDLASELASIDEAVSDPLHAIVGMADEAMDDEDTD